MHAFMGGGFQEKPVNMPGDAGCARAAGTCAPVQWALHQRCSAMTLRLGLPGVRVFPAIKIYFNRFSRR